MMSTIKTNTTKTIKIEDIKVGNRFRKDLGDIDDLANSIKKYSLFHPIVINENNELVAGQRRIEAAKKLGWNEIPYTVVNISNLIDGELTENIVRKDFTFSERQAILDEVENGRLGHRQKKGSNLQPFQEQNKAKKSVNIVADYTGISPRQLSKEKAIVQAVEQKPHLEYLVKKIDNGEMSVNEADETIKYLDEDSKKRGKWFKLKEEVLKGDSYKCRQCGTELHLDVYTISPYHDKNELENLETLCKDCHKLNMQFGGNGIITSLAWIFQHLTGMTGKRYFEYSTIGGNILYDIVRNKELSADDEQMKDNPYVKLKRSSNAEIVSKTREHRKQILSSVPFLYGDSAVYVTNAILHELLPVLNDFSEMIDKEAEARRRKDKLSKP
jgi:ParB-like chromosome segregation protein Spo0J